MMNTILYHENNRKQPYLPQEDAYSHAGDVYVVADGVTHDKGPDGMYPMPSDSAKVAEIACSEISNFLLNKKPSYENVRLAFEKANKEVRTYNSSRPLYIERENNGYTIGAATCSMVWINGNRLLYGVVDDCFISIFSDDYIDHPMLKSYVEQSAKFLDTNFDWSQQETRRIWREDIRNKVYNRDGKEYGYGVIDGRDGFVRYLQVGEVDLKPGDLICVYTDGFIKMLQNIDFVKTLREKPFSDETFEYISQQCEKLGNLKEKTAYFIRHG